MRIEELRQMIKSEVDCMGEGDYQFMCQLITLIRKHNERGAAE